MKKSFVLMLVLGVALLAAPALAQPIGQQNNDGATGYQAWIPVEDNNAVVPVGDSNTTNTVQGVEIEDNNVNAVVPVGDSNNTTAATQGGVAVDAKDNIVQGQGQGALGLPAIPDQMDGGVGGQFGAAWNQQAATGTATNNNLSGKFANTGSATDQSIDVKAKSAANDNSQVLDDSVQVNDNTVGLGKYNNNTGTTTDSSINVDAKNAAQGDATVQDAGDDAINVKDNQVNLQLGKFNAAPNANQAVTDNSLSDVLAKNVNSNGTQTNTDNSQNGVLGKNVNGTGTQTNTDNSVNVFAKNAAYGIGNIQDVEVEKGGTLVSGNGNAAGNEVEKGGVLQNGIGNIAAEEVEKGGIVTSGSKNVGNEDSVVDSTFNTAISDAFKSGKYVENTGTINDQSGKYNINGDNTGGIADIDVSKGGILAAGGTGNAIGNEVEKGGVLQNGATNWNVGEVEKGGTFQAGDGNISGIEVEKGGVLTNGTGNIAGNEKSVIGSTFNTAVSVTDSFKAGNTDNSGTINQAEKGAIAGNTGTINIAEKGGQNVGGDVVEASKGGIATGSGGTVTVTETKGQFVNTSGVNINNEDKSGGFINKSAFETTFDHSFHNNAKVEAEALGLIGLQNSLQTVTVTELRQVNSGIVIGDFAGNSSTMTVGGNNSATNGVVATAYNMAGNAVNNAAQNVVNVTGPTTQTLSPSTAISVNVDSLNTPAP